LKEYRVLYQNIISDFDMLYFSFGAAIGIFYILLRGYSVGLLIEVELKDIFRNKFNNVYCRF
jgi:hypothetical protein